MRLQSKTVLITGGTKGIGKACAKAFANERANVIITYGHDDKVAKETEAELQKNGSRVLTIKAEIEARSDARRNGKECRSRWSPYH